MSLAWRQSSQPGAGHFTRWDHATGSGPPDTSGGCPDGGRTLYEEDTGDSIHFVVDCPVAAALMFKVAYHPKWVVTVDGRPVETFRVSPSCLAVDLPVGRHEARSRGCGHIGASRLQSRGTSAPEARYPALIGSRASSRR